MDDFKEKWNNYLYYFIVGILSLITLIFLPMLGSEVGMAFNFPTTVAGWIVYIISQLIVAVINVLLFHSFVMQARLNVKDNENYLKALAILRTNKAKDYIPRSLAQFNRKEYGVKGVWIFIGSIMACFALGQALLTYDYAKLISYLFTIIMGIIFGILEMKKFEEYLTTEFYDYALMVERELIQAKEFKNMESSNEESIDSVDDTDSNSAIAENEEKEQE